MTKGNPLGTPAVKNMEQPKRKHPRLKEYDYSQPGYYYVTIHTANSDTVLSTVGRGLAPAVTPSFCGNIAEQELLALEKRYDYLVIDKYVIMPTHIHAILVLKAGASPRPTLTDIIGAYKSITTRRCNQELDTPGQKRFQTSFYESVLRNTSAYQECWRYIDENPLKWSLCPEDR